MPKRAAWTLTTAVYFIVLGAFLIIIGLAGIASFVTGPPKGVQLGSTLWGLGVLGLAVIILFGFLFLRYTVKRWGKWEGRIPVTTQG